MLMDHPNWLKQRAELTPDRMAVIQGDHKLTFIQLFHEAKNGQPAEELWSEEWGYSGFTSHKPDGDGHRRPCLLSSRRSHRFAEYEAVNGRTIISN